MDLLTGLVMLVVVVAVLVAMFLLLRQLALWYWRINEAVELLKSIDEKLSRMATPSVTPDEPWISTAPSLREPAGLGDPVIPR